MAGEPGEEAGDDDGFGGMLCGDTVADDGGLPTRDGPLSLNESFCWAEQYLKHMEQFFNDVFLRIVSSLSADPGFRLVTDYSGMGCAEMALGNILASLCAMGHNTNMKYHRATDILPHCRHVPSLARTKLGPLPAPISMRSNRDSIRATGQSGNRTNRAADGQIRSQTAVTRSGKTLLAHRKITSDASHVFSNILDRIPQESRESMFEYRRLIDKELSRLQRATVSGRALQQEVQELGRRLHNACKMIMSPVRICRDRRAACMRHGRQCPVAREPDDPLEMRTLAVAGVTCAGLGGIQIDLDARERMSAANKRAETL